MMKFDLKQIWLAYSVICIIICTTSHKFWPNQRYTLMYYKYDDILVPLNEYEPL